MNLEEFTNRTNLYPDDVLFKVIHNEYARHNEWDKDEFCAAYLENRDHIAERIQFEANEERAELNLKIHDLMSQVDQLNDQLEASKEWKPVECNYMDYVDYIHGCPLKDEDAREIVAKFVGDVHPDSISIIRKKGLWEKNRYGELRKTESVMDMPPWGCNESEDSSKIFMASIAFRFGTEECVLNIDDGIFTVKPVFKFSNSVIKC